MSERVVLFVFQFHEGPIKTCKDIEKIVACLLFQFHEGPIKTPLHFSVRYLYIQGES